MLHGVRLSCFGSLSDPSFTILYLQVQAVHGRNGFDVLNAFVKLLTKSEETQISALIYSMGDQSEDILKSFTLS